MKRILCMHFPSWPLQCCLRNEPALRGKPLALDNSDRWQTLAVVDRRGRVLGIRSGMPLAEALATLPTLEVRPYDPKTHREELERLALWAERFSPIVALDESPEPDSLLLDITGCTACFGGEQELISQATAAIRSSGWQARLRVGDTVGTAWALARFSPAGEDANLSLLPLAGLRLSADILSQLQALGLERIGQLEALPTTQLRARFGPELLKRLEQFTGRMAEPLVPHRPLPPLDYLRVFEFAVVHRDYLYHSLDELLHQATIELERRGQGIHRLEMDFTTEDGGLTSFCLSLLRPSREFTRLSNLLRTKLEQIQVPGPVQRLSLRLRGEEPLIAEQGLLNEDQQVSQREWAEFVDVLCAKFQPEEINTVALTEDHQPEFMYQTQPASSSPALVRNTSNPKVLRHRPLRLWHKPKAMEVIALTPPGSPRLLRWQGRDWPVVHALGPERLETGWWRGQDVRRDYYTVETRDGRRWWLFRRLEDGRWFWHGCFD